ncbi:hypothetical protein HYT02_01965 [Candidatus Gottesmanbacteria bacterium]|nr:hypothetical protein [Candidatus Gottesmanbacteria bacterium]
MTSIFERLLGRRKKEVTIPEPKVISSETFLGRLEPEERSKVEHILGMAKAIQDNPGIKVIGLGSIADANTPKDAAKARDIDLVITTDTPPGSEARKSSNLKTREVMMGFLKQVDLEPIYQIKTSIKRKVVRGGTTFKELEEIDQPGIKTGKLPGIRPIHILLQSDTGPSHSGFMRELQATQQTHAILLPPPGGPTR